MQKDRFLENFFNLRMVGTIAHPGMCLLLLLFTLGCTVPDVKLELLSKEMPGPVLKTGGVENVDFPDTQKFLEFGGSCDLRTKSLKVGFKKEGLSQISYEAVPSVSAYYRYPGDIYTTDITNDLDCSNGDFSFILSLQFILGLAEVATADELKDQQIEAIYITGETLIGDTKPMILPVGGNGDGPHQNQATKLVLRKFNPWNAASKYNCVPVNLAYLDNNNFPGYIPNEGVYAIVDGNSTQLTSYRDINECISAINPSVTFPIPQGNPYLVRYLKFDTLGTQSIQLAYISGHSLDVSSSMINLQIRDGSATDYRFLSFNYDTPRSIARGACYLVTVRVHFGDGTEDSYSNRTAVLVNLSSTNSGVKFFSDSSCSTQVSSVSIPNGISQQSFWISYPGSAAPSEQILFNQIIANGTGQLNAGPTPLFIDSNENFVHIDDTAHNMIEHIYLGLPQNMLVGACNSVHLETSNRNGTPIPVPAGGLTLNLHESSVNFDIFSSPSCYPPSMTSSSIESGKFQKELYIKGLNASTNEWFVSTILGGTVLDSSRETFTFSN